MAALALAPRPGDVVGIDAPAKVHQGQRAPGVGTDLPVVHVTLPPGGTASLMHQLQSTVGNQALQRMLSSGAGAPATTTRPTMAQRLAASAGRGRPIAREVRQRIEPAAGADLSDVRVHDDAEADALATEAGAAAFTTGRDIYFAAGEHQPGTSSGLRTLAHEAAHVVQQSRGPVAGTPTGGGVSVSDPGDAFEQAAEHVAEGVTSGQAPGLSAGPAPAGGGGASVQRSCGCGCGGSGGSCTTSSSEQTEEPTSVQTIQRLPAATATTGAPVLQRRKRTTTSGGVAFTFDPAARLNPGAAGDTSKTFDQSNAEAFDVPPGQPGTLLMPILMSWQSAGGGGGGNGGGGLGTGLLSCDPCERLASARLGPLQGVSDENLGKCRELPTLAERRKFFRELLGKALLNPCILAASDFGTQFGCNFLVNVPPQAAAARAVLTPILTGLLTEGAIVDALPNCQNAKDPGKQTPTPKKEAKGTGRAVLESRFAFNPDGSMTLFGAGVTTESSGSGAEVVVPTEFTRTPVPGQGGFVSLSPAMRIIGGPADESTRVQEAFTVDLRVPPPPQPVDVEKCERQFSPFEVGKDTFKPDETLHLGVADWWFGLHPLVRGAAERGELTVKVTGRASSTGKPDKNLELSRKRAQKVATIITGLAGSSSKLNVVFLGELLAPQPELEIAEERRAEVLLQGKLSGADAAKITGSQCFGHRGETAGDTPVAAGVGATTTGGAGAAGTTAGATAGTTSGTVGAAAGAAATEAVGGAESAPAPEPLGLEVEGGPGPTPTSFGDAQAGANTPEVEAAGLPMVELPGGAGAGSDSIPQDLLSSLPGEDAMEAEQGGAVAPELVGAGVGGQAAQEDWWS